MKRFFGFICVFVLLITSLPVSAEKQNDRDFVFNSISVLKKEEIPKTPEGIEHYLLISMDKWQNNPENPGYNDGLVLLTLDSVAGRVMVTSIIRDLLVIKPNGNPARINRIVRQHDVQGLLDTINTHFGLEVNKYVLMDWRHIMEIVDAAGGTDIQLTGDEVSYLKGWSVPENSTQPVLTKAGKYHLNGFATVIYMRIRKRRALNDDTHDLGRTYRARVVLTALAKNLRSYTITQAQELLTKILNIWEQPFDKNYTYPGIRNNGIFTFGDPPRDKSARRYATNITMVELLEAMRVAFLLRGCEIEQFRLPADGTVRPYLLYNGASQLADFEENRRLLHEFMFQKNFVVQED
ncbi:MAG: LCP family protein [Bacillota bacterium]|nr:LCP family protein [Bacillota bacterium]